MEAVPWPSRIFGGVSAAPAAATSAHSSSLRLASQRGPSLSCPGSAEHGVTVQACPASSAGRGQVWELSIRGEARHRCAVKDHCRCGQAGRRSVMPSHGDLREVSEQFRRTTLGRIGERGVHLIHGEASPPGPGHFAPRHSLRRPVRRRLQDRHGESCAQARRDLIVSGGAIGIEYATIFSALGIFVTILDAALRLRADAVSWAPPRAGSSRSGRPAQTGLPRRHRSSAGRPRDRRDRLGDHRHRPGHAPALPGPPDLTRR